MRMLMLAAGAMLASVTAQAAGMPDSGPAWACAPNGGRDCLFATGRMPNGYLVMGTRVAEGGKVVLGAGIVDCRAGRINYREDDGGVANGKFEEGSVPWLLCREYGQES